VTDSTATLTSLRTLHAAECERKYAEFPGQEANRQHYDAFRASAKLGKITKAPGIKGRKVLVRGTAVLFTIDEHDRTLAHVWAPGYSALIQASAIKAAG
jgi:hypothetical protein